MHVSASGTQSFAQPAGVELPRGAFGPAFCDVSGEFVSEREPFASFAQVRELSMPLLFEGSSAALEGEKLFMADAGESLPRTHAGADLDPAIES